MTTLGGMVLDTYIIQVYYLWHDTYQASPEQLPSCSLNSNPECGMSWSHDGGDGG